MFDQLPETMKTRQRGIARALTFAVVAHAVAFTGLGIANAIEFEPLDPPPITVVFLSAAAPPPPPPPPAPRKPKPKPPTPVATPPPVQQAPKEVVQPQEIPKELPDKTAEGGLDGGEGDWGVEGGIEGGVVGGVPGGVLGGVEGGVVQEEEPLRVGGDVEPPVITKQVQPRYPEVAKAARVQGVVILEAIINTQGKVENVRVLRGNPLLEEAAKEAIVKWEFKPGRLNGKPVRVYFTLTVNFTLK